MLAQSLDKLLKGYITAVKADQESKGIKSSGSSAASLRAEINDNGGAVYGSKYFYQQKHGRKPGKYPPIEDILNWIKAKGIQADIPDRSLAFLIARKIAKSGTDIFQGKRPALNVEEKTKELLKKFIEDIMKDYKEEIKKELNANT